MNIKMFGLFATIKNLEQNIKTYTIIANTLRDKGLEMYKPWFIDDYPFTKMELANKVKRFSGNNKQIHTIDFAVAEFSTKSRTVFFQTIYALEHKVPVLCVVKKGKESNIPISVKNYSGDFLTIHTYSNAQSLKKVLLEYLKELNPPKKRYNVMLPIKTLRKFESLTKELDISKADLIRRLIEKEYRRVFNGK